MIRAFIVSSEAASVDARERRWLRERLEFGNVLGGKPQDWIQFINSLPAEEKLLWREIVLQHAKYFTVGIDEITSFEDERLTDARKQIIPAIVALGSSERERLEVGQHPEYPITSGNAEFIPAHELRTSESGRTSSTTFAKGSSRNTVWNTLLHPILSVASSVVIVDGFLFDSIARRSGVPAANSDASGLVWLLQKTQQLRHGEGLPIQAITSYDESTSHADILKIWEILDEQFPSASLRLVACRRSIYRKLVHHRYLRVIVNGRSRCLIQIDPGVDGLDTNREDVLTRSLDFINRTATRSKESDDAVLGFQSEEDQVTRVAIQSGVVLLSKRPAPISI